MKSLIVISACMLILGCASHSQLLVNCEGTVVRCGSYGYGLVGVVTADQIQSDCLASWKSAGFIELEKAGAIGIYFSEPTSRDTIVTVLKVADKSPAQFVGIQPGDIIREINGQPVRSIHDAKILLFGMAGSPVRISLGRGEVRTDIEIIRAPYNQVFGVPKTQSGDRQR